MNPTDIIVLSYSPAEDVFHSDTIVEFTAASQQDILGSRPTRYVFVGIFPDRDQGAEYMTAFRAKLIKAKVGKRNHIYEDQPEEANRITD